MKVLTDRVAVVTGGGSGIGRATSLLLSERGCHLAIADRDAVGLDETASMIRARGGRVSTHLLDVTDAAAIAALPEAVISEHGGCHILINNAGVTSAGAFESESIEDLEWIVGINVWGVVRGCRAFLPVLREADEAHIVNLSSMVGLLGLPHNVAYSLTKGAVRSFTEALRAELVTSSIGVTAVFPGAIRTNITSAARGAESERLAKMGQSRLAPYVMRPPSAVATRIVAGIDHNRARVVVGPDAHAVDMLCRLVPGRAGLVGRLTNRFTG